MEIFLKILKIAGLVLAGAAGYVLLSVIIGFLSGLFTGHKKEYKTDSKFYRFVLNSMTGLVLFFARVKIVKKGVDLPEGRFLIVGNHRSNLDPIVSWYKFRKKNISYISKPQNLKIPFYGAIVRRCCFLPIDRESARNAVTTIEKAAELLKNDVVSIGVYPEGTRSKTCRLLKFHNGVFKIAQKAEVPIVVVSVSGTEKVKKNCPWRRTVVTLDVAEVIPPEVHMTMQTNEIGEHVRALLAERLEEEYRS